MRKLIGGTLALGLSAGLAAQSAGLFEFSPVPRWQTEPESEPLCEAIRAECPSMAAKGSIDATMAFDEVHDVNGKLAGLRLVTSTGCKPLDEAMLVGRKEFRQRFEADGAPTYDDFKVELKAGINPADVRIVRRVDNFQIGMGC